MTRVTLFQLLMVRFFLSRDTILGRDDAPLYYPRLQGINTTISISCG
jgi:hypothetical protein